MLAIPSIPLSIEQKDLIILLLGVLATILFVGVIALTRSLKKEKNRKNIPSLSLELSLQPGHVGLYLKNHSDTPAKDVILENLDVPIEADLGGILTLKFESISSLAPHQQEKLQFKIFNRSFELAHISTDHLMPHISSAELKIHLTFSNLEKIHFFSILQKEKHKNKFTIQEVKAVG